MTGLREAKLHTAILRAVLLSVAIGGFAMMWLKHCWPGIEIQPLQMLAKAILAFLAYILLFIAIQWFVPPRISVTKKAVTIQEGQHVSSIPYADIGQVTIDLSDREHPVLIVDRIRPRRKTRRIGIADRIDPVTLARFLEAVVPGRVMTTGTS